MNITKSKINRYLELKREIEALDDEYHSIGQEIKDYMAEKDLKSYDTPKAVLNLRISSVFVPAPEVECMLERIKKEAKSAKNGEFKERPSLFVAFKK